MAHDLYFRAEMQVATTQDYATGSWFWTVFTGKIINVSTILIELIGVRNSFINYVFFMPQFPFRSLVVDFVFQNGMQPVVRSIHYTY